MKTVKEKRIMAMAEGLQFEAIKTEGHLILYRELQHGRYINCDFDPDGMVTINDPYGEPGERLDFFRYTSAKKAIDRFLNAILKCLN
jgi:hypothetical protein